MLQLSIVPSSPHRKLGILFDAHRKYFGNDAATRGLYIMASSRDLNPLINEQDIAEAMEDDPAAAQSEYLGFFREDLQGFLDDATVDAAIVPGRRELPRSLTCKHLAFCDPSGGRGDAMTLGVAHQEPAPAGVKTGGRVVLDCLQAAQPPFDTEATVERHRRNDHELRQRDGADQQSTVHPMVRTAAFLRDASAKV